VVKDGVRKALSERQDALGNLVDGIRLYRKLADSKPLTLQGSDFAQAVEELNKAIERAERLILQSCVRLLSTLTILFIAGGSRHIG